MGLVKTRRLAAMQKQQRAKAGTGSVAKVGVLPVPLLPIPNWELKLDIGNTGDTGNIIPSALPNAPTQGPLPTKPLARKPVFVLPSRATSHIRICVVARCAEDQRPPGQMPYAFPTA